MKLVNPLRELKCIDFASLPGVEFSPEQRFVCAAGELAQRPFDCLGEFRSLRSSRHLFHFYHKRYGLFIGPNVVARLILEPEQNRQRAYSVPESVMARADDAITKSLAIDDLNANAHAIHGAVLSFYHWRWKDADRAFRRALDLNPTALAVHAWYANYLVATCRLA